MQEIHYDPEELDQFKKLFADEEKRTKQITESLLNSKVKTTIIHKPGSSVIIKGTEYVLHTSGQWRNQTTGLLVDDPMEDAN